jgi:hypothetical protein
MSECMAETVGTETWSGLLEETRQALSTLRVEGVHDCG